MPKKKTDPATPPTTDPTPPAEGQQTLPAEEAAPPARPSNDVLPSVTAAAKAIKGCTEHEVKNYVATLDYVSRQLAILIADRWEEICKTAAEAAGEEDNDPKKVGLSVKIEIDQTNMLFMDTSVSVSFSKKYTAEVHTEEDLRQTEFPLK